MGGIIKKRRWSNWEKKVIASAEAVITVSKTIAQEHRKITKNVFVLPNFPLLMSVKDLSKQPISEKDLYTVYMGKVTPPQISFRNVEGLLDLFVKNKIGKLVVIGDNSLKASPPIYSRGYMNYLAMLQELTKYHIGIIPWKKHPFHKYSNPNKAYEYANTGLLVLVVSDLIPVIETLNGYVKTFNSYDDLVELLRYYSNNIEEAIEIGYKTMKYAKKNLVWEKNEPLLQNVYEKIV